jgi:hypothetical protein
MAFDQQDNRPITFQSVTFPATLMGASVLDPVLDITDDELADWLLRFTTCRGVTKRAPSETCARCAQRLIDLMLEQRQRVLDGIRDRLVPHGFEVEDTYRDWIMAFQQIVKLSTAANGDCVWSAPLHPDDRLRSSADAERFVRRLTGNDLSGNDLWSPPR